MLSWKRRQGDAGCTCIGRQEARATAVPPRGRCAGDQGRTACKLGWRLGLFFSTCFDATATPRARHSVGRQADAARPDADLRAHLAESSRVTLVMLVNWKALTMVTFARTSTAPSNCGRPSSERFVKKQSYIAHTTSRTPASAFGAGAPSVRAPVRSHVTSGRNSPPWMHCAPRSDEMAL